MTRCIWVIQEEGEYSLAVGDEGGIATLLGASIYKTPVAAKSAAERAAMQGSSNAVYGVLAPPAGVRDYPRGPVYRPERVLADGWSWVEVTP